MTSVPDSHKNVFKVIPRLLLSQSILLCTGLASRLPKLSLKLVVDTFTP